MKFPTYEEMAQNVAEKALDEYEYNGKTLRQWIEIISASASEDAISREAALNEFCHSCDGWSCNPNTCCKTEWIRKLPPIQPDNNSEVPNSSDCISRQAAIDALYSVDEYNSRSVKAIKQLPPIQSEIIRCRECKFASGDSRICMKFDHSPIGELDFCSFAERREVNNESN